LAWSWGRGTGSRATVAGRQRGAPLFGVLLAALVGGLGGGMRRLGHPPPARQSISAGPEHQRLQKRTSDALEVRRSPVCGFGDRTIGRPTVPGGVGRSSLSGLEAVFRQSRQSPTRSTRLSPGQSGAMRPLSTRSCLSTPITVSTLRVARSCSSPPPAVVPGRGRLDD
jgi:hypothetical protein